MYYGSIANIQVKKGHEEELLKAFNMPFTTESIN